ncbi:ATP-dependent endonuclease [Vibrio vulnificus]|uniref:ATP-dependent nuclease n=1 Tax=Vibrio vulnificus TaxID=672 RepID=UPI0010293067|nr:TOPRIM nucleotidyl transferase/hydrolase domain-containing protein [Vibrio vulnificus]RZQ40090.1 ATP-dependent endonuclease [Vibrio vulnificus]
MKTITKIQLRNFKKYQEFNVDFDPELNLLIGDNEAGKSTNLTAIELVLSGSKSKVETAGLDTLFNTSVVQGFLASNKKLENLPILIAELHLNEQDNPSLNGKNNIDGINADGLRLICEPNEELSYEIAQVLAQPEANFPFEFYSIKFVTFSGEAYTGYRKFLKYLTLDSSQINNEYATKEYIKTVYESHVEQPQRIGLQNDYRQQKTNFKENNLKPINDRLSSYQFAIRSGTKFNLETDLTITEDDVPLENKGKGRQCFIKTEFALQRSNPDQDLDVLLLEEPENHLSHTNMKKLVDRISKSEAKQIFIATHSSLISTRLDLRRTVFMNSKSTNPLLLKDLPSDTAKFFMKAPDNNVLEFVMSSKVILVEGDAEYMLIEQLYKSATGSTPEQDDVHIISVGGTSFKRYLDIAKLLGIKVAVIRDNDGDHQTNCVDGFVDYTAENMQVFYDDDDNNWTFEVCMLAANFKICDELFTKKLRKKPKIDEKTTLSEYMLSHKADVAFELLDKKAKELVSPDYITRAFVWINE